MFVWHIHNVGCAEPLENGIEDVSTPSQSEGRRDGSQSGDEDSSPINVVVSLLLPTVLIILFPFSPNTSKLDLLY